MNEISIAEGVILELESMPTCSRILTYQIRIYLARAMGLVHQERDMRLLEHVKDNMKFKINIGWRVVLAIHIILFASVFSNKLNDYIRI